MLGTRLLIGGSHHLLNYLHLLEVMKVIFFRNLRAFTDKSLALLVFHLFWTVSKYTYLFQPSLFSVGIVVIWKATLYCKVYAILARKLFTAVLMDLDSQIHSLPVFLDGPSNSILSLRFLCISVCVHAAPPQHVLSGFLHSFLDSSRTNAPFPAVRLPELGLSQTDKGRIRDRSSIMGRHIFADRGDAFADSQVFSILCF
jgi:hypothetical protein